MKSTHKISRTFLFTIMTFTLLSFFSCSTEDDSGGGETQNESFKVELVKIKATAITNPSENGHLEIFGTMTSKLVIEGSTNVKTLWSIEEADAISVTTSESQLTGTTSFTIDRNDMSGSTFFVEGQLMERDNSNPNDNLGSASTSINLNNIGGVEEFDIMFTTDPDQQVAITYRVTKL